MMDSLCLLDLPVLVQLKIVSTLDPYSILQLSQSCKMLREIVKQEYLTDLILPNDAFSTEEHSRKKLKVLRLKLNINACSTPFYWNRSMINYEGLELAKILKILKRVNFDDTVEIFINLTYGSPTFEKQPQEDYKFLQGIFKKMDSLRKFKLAVNCELQDSVISNIHYKHIDDLMKFSCAKKVILKLPAFAKQRFGSVFIPKIVKSLVVIGPCFGFSGKKQFLNKNNKNITLRFMNGICLHKVN